MKWSSIEPEQGVFNFGPVDEVGGGSVLMRERANSNFFKIYDFAEARGLRVRGHNICWDQQTPDYVTSITNATERG